MVLILSSEGLRSRGGFVLMAQVVPQLFLLVLGKWCYEIINRAAAKQKHRYGRPSQDVKIIVWFQSGGNLQLTPRSLRSPLVRALEGILGNLRFHVRWPFSTAAATPVVKRDKPSCPEVPHEL